MDVLGSGSRSEEQVPSGGGQLPIDGVALFWVDSRIGFDKLKVMVNHTLSRPKEGPTCGAKSWLIRVGKVYIPVGNVFEKPCPRLRTTW